jgi:hypothetical protein
LSETVEATLGRLVQLFAALGIDRYALTGGIAFGVWGEARETRDLDVTAVLPERALLPLLAQFDGIRFGSSEIPDVVRFRLRDWDVDLFVAKSDFDQEILSRATAVAIGGVSVRIVTVEDLILHKLRKLRADRRRILRDAADLRILFEQNPDLDLAWIERHSDEADRTLLTAIRGSTDEELLTRLLGGAR